MEYRRASQTISESNVNVLLTFKQLDISDGTFERITKIIELNKEQGVEIELGPRQHVDWSDALGLIELSPQVYDTLGIEGKPQVSDS